MIKLLEDLLIEATTNPNVPGNLVAGLRKAVETARAEASPWCPRRVKDGKAYDLPGAGEPATVRVKSSVAQTHQICVKSGGSHRVGDMVASAWPFISAGNWAPCDKDGWIQAGTAYATQPGLHFEFDQARNAWRPGLPAHAEPKPSALDEMAAQAASWRGRSAEVAAMDVKPTGIDATLAERGSRYGKFEDHSEVAQALKKVVFTKRPRETLAADQVEALEMICHKLGRIANGDPDYADSWVDIAGYAKLVADRLEGVSR